MSVYNYLQLQPVDPQDDGTVSDLDVCEQDETIDLANDTDGEELERGWDAIEQELHHDSDAQGDDRSL